jgi:hypothetical protein
MTQVGVPAKLDRQLLADFFNGGVNAAGSLAVTSTGAPRSVSIAPGAAYIPGTSQPDQGTYRLTNDAAVTLVHDPATTFPRVDQIIARVVDTDYGGGLDAGSIEIAKGAEANGATALNRNGAASDPSLEPTYIRLADVLVPVGASPVISSSNIQDRRVLAGLKAGGQVPIGSIIPWVGSGDVGDGYWIAADGRLIDKTIYSTFFARAQHTYNNGVDPGSNKVRVPDKRGRSSVGAFSFGTDGLNGVVALSSSDNTRVNLARGASTGERNHINLAAESGMPSHTPVLNFNGAINNHVLNDAAGPTAYKSLNDGSSFSGDITRTVLSINTVPAQDASSAHNTVHPVQADNYIVRIA